MRVVEIFKSIEGEGIRTGKPAVFIRLFGCNLRCNYCDTEYGWKEEEKERTHVKSVDEIMKIVSNFDCNRVTITGGEPMIHPGIDNLIESLLCCGYEVNVETNGTVPFPNKFDCVDFIYTMDWKSRSSGMHERMCIANAKTLRRSDVLKFVVANVEDLEEVINVCDQLKYKPNIYISPVYGKITPKEIVNFVLNHKLYYCTVQVQLHKIIWDVNQRGV